MRESDRNHTDGSTSSRGSVVHALHSFYGKDNFPGGRSRRIAESPHRTANVTVYALFDRAASKPHREVAIIRSINSFLERARRFIAVRLLPPARKRRFALLQFDRNTARRIRRMPKASVSVVHIWNWLPTTVATVRKRHPDAVVIRDIAIAREHDFELGEDIRNEDRSVDAFISPSAYATEQLTAWGIPANKIHQVPFGVDSERFSPGPSSRDDRTKDSPIRFAFSGAVSARKGVPELLRVWREISLDGAELHLYGTVKSEVAPLLASTNAVIAHGFTDLTNELPRNDVFVFPSHREGSAKAVYEAMACGLPVITTPNAGSVARDGIEGLIVAAGDTTALAHAMRTLAADNELRLRMGAAARKRAEEFTWDRYSRRVWCIYDDVAVGSALKRTERGSEE